MNKKLNNALLAFVLFLMPAVAFGQAPSLGTAAKFVLFTTDGAMTGSGTRYLTHLTGDVGSNLAGSVTGFGNVDGVIRAADTATAHATSDVISLYTQLITAIPTGTIASPFGHGDTLVEGVYSSVGAATLTGNLVLNGQGNPNALFIFQIGGLWSTDALSKVKLINGALACNVFWQIGGAVNIGTGTSIKGTIVANGQIDMTSTHDTLEGRAFALNAAVIVSQLIAYTPLGCGSPLLTGPVAPTLVATSTYGVFSSIGSVTSTPVTYVTGNVGANSTIPSGFDPLNVTGAIHGMDTSTAAAAGDLTNVYNYLVALPADINLLDPANFGHDLVLTPHSYQITGITQMTGNLILNAQGYTDAVFVIKINGAFTTSTSSKVMLINGAQAKNVYWKVDGATDIFSNSVFNGTIVGAGAISLETGDTLNGKALTINGAVAINSSYINIAPPACAAAPITGTPQVCQGFSTVLSDVDTGGTWTSSNNAIATIGSSSGVLTGLAPGVDTITYMSPLSCTSTMIITVNPAPATITGADNVCTGSTITLSDTSSGGTWSSSNLAIGTVGSTTGIVRGITAGVDTIAYTLSTGCMTQKSITVNPLTNAGTINGMLTVCPGAFSPLSDTVLGGVWSSVTPATATIGSSTGIVTGVALGTTTISYTVTGICGTTAATKVVTVSATPNAGVITGIATVCPGATTSLSDAAGGGVWSSVIPVVATIDPFTGVVTGIIPGTTTISYTVNTSCGTAAATKIVTVNPSTNAGTITGTATVCPGATTALSDAVTGGIWSSVTPAVATVGSTGVVTGVTFGTSTISYTVNGVCGSAAATRVVTVNAAPNAGIINGMLTICPGASSTLSNTVVGGVWSSVTPATATIGSVTGIVTGVALGTTTISYTVNNSCGTAAATKVVTVSATPDAGTITGPVTVCQGSTITLSDAAAGGVWSSVTPLTATIDPATGIVTGITPGTTTISYTVISSCGTVAATTIITVNSLPDAGIITGPSNVCIGSSVTLTDAVPGGVWGRSNANATVSGGVVTGVIAGVDTISYTVNNACGTATATKIMTIDPTPNAGVIIGPGKVCIGSTIVLTDLAAGGVWSASNTNATVLGGLVTGVAAGVDTISYTVSNISCTSTATKIVTVDAAPNAGIITGPSTVCTGSSIILTDFAPGGSWSVSNTNAMVIGGVVIGVIAGVDTVSYTVSNTCGSSVATHTVTVNTTPSAGVISGPSSVCTGSTIVLTDPAAGGIWSASNTNASVLGGVVTGITAGLDTIMYTVSNLSCTSTATKIVTINTIPNAGAITGPSTVCTGSSITLTDLSPGGSWSASNGNASVAGGIVTGVAAGIDTIIYKVSNTCGADSATKSIVINTAPDAGVINGLSNVCVGSSITLTDPASGGVWSATNANALVFGGSVFGVVAGTDTILYTVANLCGADTAFKVVTVGPLPDAGIIVGPSVVCVGSSIVLTDGTPGGVWSASNATATVVDGLVTGVTAGTDSIMYTVTNACGTNTAVKLVTVNPLPDAGTILGPSSVCVGSSITLTNTATGGTWSASNANAIVLGSLVIGMAAGVDTIIYTVSDLGCTATAMKAITIDPLPDAGNITGPSTVCVGSAITLTDAQAGGIWSASNAHASVSGGIVTGVTAGIDTIMYTVSNSCGTDIATMAIAVDAVPAAPMITTQSPSSVCDGTMFQNFGAATLPPSGVVYSWTASNAAVWAQGATHQYALVNFNEPGTAYITLTASGILGACASSTTVTVNVGTDVAQSPIVQYFNNHFVCTPATESSYQWGYDNIVTLDSTILAGEINQDYLNVGPDFAHKFYWVMTTSGGCSQKTYYLTPTILPTLHTGASVTIYPNPAENLINVDISATASGLISVSVYNMLGQKLSTVETLDNKASIDLAGLAAGSYLIICNQDGVKIAGATFIKN